jgi:hypothetical protein
MEVRRFPGTPGVTAEEIGTMTPSNGADGNFFMKVSSSACMVIVLILLLDPALVINRDTDLNPFYLFPHFLTIKIL